MSKDLLKCNKLNKWYGNLHALKNVDLEINKGEVIGLIGDNGAGKSTLIKIICGVHGLDDGEIYFEGNKVDIKNPKTAMDLGIETIHQYNTMFQEMSIARNVFIGREPVKFGLSSLSVLNEEKMNLESMKAIKDVGLDLRSPHIPVKELSGGERQRTHFCRCLMQVWHDERPPDNGYLLLDEPTSSQDVANELAILNLVRDAAHKGLGVCTGASGHVQDHHHCL